MGLTQPLGFSSSSSDVKPPSSDAFCQKHVRSLPNRPGVANCLEAETVRCSLLIGKGDFFSPPVSLVRTPGGAFHNYKAPGI